MLQRLTVNVAAVLPEELESVRMIVLYRLGHVDDVSVSVVIPTDRLVSFRGILF